MSVKMPLPRFALVAYVLVVCSGCVASLASADATYMNTTGLALSGMPELISPQMLLALRCTMLFVNLLAIVLKLMKSEEKIVVHAPDSALEQSVVVPIKGAVWLTFFTFQSWLLQTFYLVGATLCSTITLFGLELDLGSRLPTALWMAFEVSFAVAVLVSFIVKFVLIPTVASKGGNLSGFFQVADLLMHNCNTLFMALELLFNDLPVTFSHFPLAALWGLWYVTFSWFWMALKKVCWYDFLDPTLPKAILVHTVLVCVLGVFFALGSGLAAGAAAISSPYIRIAIVLTGVAAVSRTGLLRGIPRPRPTQPPPKSE